MCVGACVCMCVGACVCMCVCVGDNFLCVCVRAHVWLCACVFLSINQLRWVFEWARVRLVKEA